MKVRVLFFGATADAVGDRAIDLEIGDGAQLAAVRDTLFQRHPTLRNHNLLFSINQAYANAADRVADGDEVAIFTPVSGG